MKGKRLVIFQIENFLNYSEDKNTVQENDKGNTP